MNKTILTILVFCFAVLSAGAQVDNKTTATDSQKNAVDQSKIQKEKTNNERATQADNPNAAVIVFDEMVHNYGTLAYGSDGNCEFKFTNTGKEPLILKKVKAS